MIKHRCWTYMLMLKLWTICNTNTLTSTESIKRIREDETLLLYPYLNKTVSCTQHTCNGKILTLNKGIKRIHERPRPSCIKESEDFSQSLAWLIHCWRASLCDNVAFGGLEVIIKPKNERSSKSASVRGLTVSSVTKSYERQELHLVGKLVALVE